MRSGKVIDAMIRYYAGDVRRINHFLKVYGFSKAIGEMEGLDDRTQEILEVTAATHDIGIKNSEEKYGNCSGAHQQVEGPPEARKLLEGIGFEEDIIERVCFIISRHHTYKDIQGIDYQILVEADFLVNAFEDKLQEAAIKSFRDKVFRTGTGKVFLERLYGEI
ncbi:HD domain-containing protein [Youngiibacter fragilis]|uniref:HD family phosphohydrolase n=1 Tax=Youngiibacter fragilis 232.1 TaxID=994573 RepID=V7I5S2_9CLOT|nr:HD domain-containing protein [Youngiibacter fragilis]ETA81223.1 HD family phosphohydrolase [Youngiibacter fragilis 232.1]